MALLAISGAVIWALQSKNNRGPAPEELYSTDHRPTADGIAGLPRDYAGVPRQAPALGPPLPGDLGRPILNVQGQLGAASIAGATPDPEAQRRAQEIEAARLSRLFAPTNIRELPLPAISAISPSQDPSAGAGQAAQPSTDVLSGRTARIANSPSSTPRSIGAPRAPTGWPRRPRPMWCRRARSFPAFPSASRAC